jgi:pilus assembly protein Flp/PilA
MERIKSKLFNLVSDEAGLELSEYAVAGALIVVGTVLTFGALGDTIKQKIGAIITAMGGTPPA